MEMSAFQKTILFAAIIVLILCMVFIGYSLQNIQKENWPPNIPVCPDYWTVDGSGNNYKCLNTNNLGTCGLKEMNFNTPTFTGSREMCNKYTWAKNCGLAWDGITYGVQNPCDGK